MIPLTKLNHQAFVVNAELIKFIESTPDTMVTLTTGERLLVQETTDEVIRRVVEYGRTLAIADVYDALTTDRPYRQRMEPFKALKLMHEEMINHFQKDLFERFILLFNKPSGH